MILEFIRTEGKMPQYLLKHLEQGTLPLQILIIMNQEFFLAEPLVTKNSWTGKTVSCWKVGTSYIPPHHVFAYAILPPASKIEGGLYDGSVFPLP